MWFSFLLDSEYLITYSGMLVIAVELDIIPSKLCLIKY